MKTTSFKISKKLAKIGFKANTNWCYCWSGEDYQLMAFNSESIEWDGRDIPVYDLETILEALPKQHDFFSRGVGKYALRIWYHEGKAFIGYQNFEGFDKLLTLEQGEEESMADLAARLLITLHEKGLISFKEGV